MEILEGNISNDELHINDTSCPQATKELLDYSARKLSLAEKAEQKMFDKPMMIEKLLHKIINIKQRLTR